MPEIGKILRGLGGALDSTGRTNQLNAALMERSRLEEAQQEELKREELESVVNDLSKQESEMIGAIQKLPQGDPRIPLLNTALQNVQAKKAELGVSASNVPAIGLGKGDAEVSQEVLSTANTRLDEIVSSLKVPDDAKLMLSSDIFGNDRKGLEARRKAIQEARKPESSGSTLEERLIAELPPEKQASAKARLLQKKLDNSSSTSAFERMLKDSVNKKLITQEEADKLTVEKLANDALGDQSRITVDTENGTLSIEKGRSATDPNPITANKRDDLISQRDFIEQGVNMIDGVLSSPQKLGSVATLAKAVRTGGEISQDLVESAFPGAAKVVQIATDSLTSMVSTDDVEEAKKLFDAKTLDNLSILENSIGLLLARTRTPAGRIPVDVIKRSVDDVALSGLKGDEQIRNRLDQLRKQLDTSKDNLSKRIGDLGTKENTDSVIKFDSQGNRI